MSILSYLTLIIEIIIVVASVVVLTLVRNVLSENPTVRSLKTKKYIGYVMIAICCVVVMDSSFAAYRFFVPATPFEIISADGHKVVPQTGNDSCVKVIK